MDFTCAFDGTAGEFTPDGLGFIPTTHEWTGLIADLLGDWQKRSKELPPPLALRSAAEPRWLGPFTLAYLETLVRAADARASLLAEERAKANLGGPLEIPETVNDVNQHVS